MIVAVKPDTTSACDLYSPRDSKVANERSKMPQEGDLREANLNGAILADAKLGPSRLDRDFCCGAYTAASDTVTTLDVTPSHLGRIRSAKIRHHHVTAQQVLIDPV